MSIGPDTSAMSSASTPTDLPVIVIGGGQAGLSVSYCLKERGIAHLVFERHRLGEAWRSQRWDSFCLVTPNWQCALPGFSYQGHDPDGFMLKADIVGYLESYARSFQPPLREGVNVRRVSRLPSGNFEVSTDQGDFTAGRSSSPPGAITPPASLP